MKAIIELDVPGFQIGQEVTVFFKDTMQERGVCIESPVVRCGDCINRRVCVIAKKHDGFTDNKFDPDWFCADGERKD